MKLIELVNELERHAENLRRSYPGAFTKLTAGSKTYMPRFAWEIRIASGTKLLEGAIEKLKTCSTEAGELMKGLDQ